MKWRVIPNCGGHYLVSDEGKIYSRRRNKILCTHLNPDGYEVITFRHSDGKVHWHTVHRIVAEAFVPNPDGKPCVNHLNEDRADNRACNLGWATVPENINYGTRTERFSQAVKGYSRAPRPVAAYNGDVLVAQFQSQRQAHAMLGVGLCGINKCLHGKRRTAGGLTWRYVTV